MSGRTRHPKAKANIVTFTEKDVEQLTGVSQRQLRAWADDFFKPSIRTDEIGLPNLHLYSFRDLLVLKIINALRNEAKLSRDEVDAVKDRLSRLSEEMWATTTLYVLGRRVLFDDPEAREENEAIREHGVLQISLRNVVADMEATLLSMSSRRDSQNGIIERRRDVLQSQPVVAGTRIPVRSVQAFAKAGYSVEEINRQYPTLTKEDIAAALRYKSVA